MLEEGKLVGNIELGDIEGALTGAVGELEGTVTRIKIRRTKNNHDKNSYAKIPCIVQ